MAKSRRTRGVTLRALGIVAALLVVVLAPIAAASADTPWGTTGASYRAGIVCSLPDGRRVALASWAVDGTTAFSTSDVVAKGSSYGSAPTTGAATDLAAGTRGLSAADLAALAYLIGHFGIGTPTQVAETSALVAQSFGGGAAQQACLGQQGTSAAGAAALSLAARRFAGPYSVQVSAAQAKPGSSAPVSATVLSASGVPTPGIAVSFTAGAGTATVRTGDDGRATADITAPAAATPLTATAYEPIGLQLIASRPASVTVGTAQTVTGHATIVPVLHPTPRLALAGSGPGGSGGLVLAGGSLTPTATVTGSFGYSGTGTVGVVGPVLAPGGQSCSDVSYANAPTVWNGSFSFTEDGTQTAGSTGALQPGCYAFTGSVTTTDSSPAVTATTVADPSRAVGVSSVRLSQNTGSGLARTGALAATITATGVTAAAGTTISSTLTTYGPLTAGTGGRCDTGRTWSRARVLGRSATVALATQGTDRLTATVGTPAATVPGCYALVARSTVTQDGRTAVVSAAVGAAGTTVLVIAPSVGITNSAYDGHLGVPMTGTVRVTGTFGLAGRVAVGLVSAPAPDTGCRGVRFPTTVTVPPTGSSTVSTDGDGAYRFRSPVPSQNRCYGVVATLAMVADSAVQVQAPAPGDTAVFLAGAVLRATPDIEVRTVAAAPPTREFAVLGISGAAVVVVALVLMIGTSVVGERRPDPRAGALLVEFTEHPRETVGV